MRNARGEHGIALISVFLIMLAVMVVGLGTLFLTRGNLLIARNQLQTSIARTNAEGGIDAAVAVLRAEHARTGRLPTGITAAPAVLLDSGSVDYAFAAAPEWRDETVLLRVAGYGPGNAEYVTEALVEFGSTVSRGSSPFAGGVLSCRGVQLSGSGTIDSYDSRNGPYSSATRAGNVDVRTLEPNSDIVLSGGSPIYGNVRATGGVTLTGGTTISGDISASGTVRLGSGNAVIGGDVRTAGGIEFTNTTTVNGSVSANADVTFTNGARVGGDAHAGGNINFRHAGGRVDGDARAGGTISDFDSHGRQHVGGRPQEGITPVNNQPVEVEECDPLNIRSVIAGLGSVPRGRAIAMSYPLNSWTVTPEAVTHFDETWNVKAETDSGIPATRMELLGRETTVFRVPSVNLNGELRVAGGHVTLLVDGDFAASGNPKLVIEPGSSLTLLVSGRVTLGTSFRMENPQPADTDGMPAFMIMSDSRLPGSGVRVEGAGQVNAGVYAPLTGVDIGAGGGFHGAVRGGQVSLSGAGGLHYDEALGDAPIGGGDTTEGEIHVRIVSRR